MFFFGTTMHFLSQLMLFLNVSRLWGKIPENGMSPKVPLFYHIDSERVCSPVPDCE